MKFLLIALALVSSYAHAFFFPKIKTVDNLDLSKYDGRWYEVRQYFVKIDYLTMVGNKAKGRMSKRAFQESKARQNFRKTNIS